MKNVTFTNGKIENKSQELVSKAQRKPGLEKSSFKKLKAELASGSHKSVIYNELCTLRDSAVKYITFYLP